MNSLPNTEKHPVYLFNGYTWALLQQELGMQAIDNMVPITPSDNPEFKESKQPYIVYAYSEEAHGDIQALHSCTVTYVIFGQRASHVNDIVQLLSNAIGREETPRNIINWSHRSNNPFKGINIVYTDVLGSESSMPSAEEGGLVSAYITMRFRYTVPDKDFSIRP